MLTQAQRERREASFARSVAEDRIEIQHQQLIEIDLKLAELREQIWDQSAS